MGRQEYDKRYHAANAEKRREQKRAWRLANLERVRKANAAWRKANPDKIKAQAHRRRSDELRARERVAKAVRDGRLPPAWSVVCRGCDEAQGSSYHHGNGYGFDQALDVESLCADCHGREHRA